VTGSSRSAGSLASARAWCRAFLSSSRCLPKGITKCGTDAAGREGRYAALPHIEMNAGIERRGISLGTSCIEFTAALGCRRAASSFLGSSN
jgi:hypothetical protein